jgi:hypothetical protein
MRRAYAPVSLLLSEALGFRLFTRAIARADNLVSMRCDSDEDDTKEMDDVAE